MNYALTFFVFSVVSCLLGLITPNFAGKIVFFYGGFSFLLVTVAYLRIGPKIFFKSPEGRHPWFVWLLFLPFFLLNFVIFTAFRRSPKNKPFVEVHPNLFLGRRLISSESDYDFRAIVDMTSEFPEPRSIVRNRAYLLTPLLDGTAPDLEQLEGATQWIADHISKDKVYVHCAFGHSRSATVVAAYLLHIGVVKTPEEAIALLKKKRRGVSLMPSQRQVLEQFAAKRV